MLNDFFLNIVDNAQSVEVVRFGSDYKCVVDTAIWCQAKSQERQNSVSGVNKKWGVWYLSKNQVPSIRIGDEIVEQSTHYWAIIKIDLSDISGTIRCVCYQMDFERYTDGFFDLFRQEKSQEPSGTITFSWTLVQTGLCAKMLDVTIKNDASESGVIPEQANVRVLRNFVVREPLEILPSDQLRTSDGAFYRILKIVFPPGEHGWIEIETEKFLQ